MHADRHLTRRALCPLPGGSAAGRGVWEPAQDALHLSEAPRLGLEIDLGQTLRLPRMPSGHQPAAHCPVPAHMWLHPGPRTRREPAGTGHLAGADRVQMWGTGASPPLHFGPFLLAVPAPVHVLCVAGEHDVVCLSACCRRAGLAHSSRRSQMAASHLVVIVSWLCWD